jgi:hypothetical protein
VGISRLFTQSVSVETFAGTQNGTATYASAATVACFVNDSRKLVRNATGAEVVSSTTLYTPLTALAAFVVGSRVTVNGRKAFVLGAYKRDSAGPVSSHHVQVDLT